MSTTAKKTAVKGVRYTPAQKKEVVDFANEYNKANGRGGQSKAADKFNISPLTVASWLKGSEVTAKAPKAAKVAKAPKEPKEAKAAKVAKSAKSKSRPGTRYTPAQKQEVVDFVNGYNAANNRGGQSKASEKFGISPLTVMAWLKSAGAPKPSKKSPVKVSLKLGRPAATAGNLSAKLSSLVALSKEIDQAEANLVSLRNKFASLKANL